jgi:quinoprotein glucose dehydrogenase
MKQQRRGWMTGMCAMVMAFRVAGASPGTVDWPVYLGDAASSHYSRSEQIQAKNVARLQVAWTYRSGGSDAQNRSQIQCNPLVIDGVVYGTTPDLKLFALDATTGVQKWRFDPAACKGITKSGVNRGLVYWAEGSDRRILYANDHFLHAIDAVTGQRIPSFGQEGSIDLKQELGRDASGLSLQATTPGVVFKDLLIMGMRLGEGPAPAAPGPVRAFNIRTGKLAWRFNTIPQPGEAGHETWPSEAYRSVGGANVWTGFALDEARGIVFCPTGSAAFDFWGGNRMGQNLYANCLIALNAQTGQRLWHFQFVHHDLWDRDLPAPPNLVTVTHQGKRIDAVAQVTKSGHVFVFDRQTGQPLFPIQEIPVPSSDLSGESAWPTQPVPLRPPPFSRQLFTHNEITDISPSSHRQVLERFSRIRPHAPFQPPSREGSIVFPGFDGGAEWGGAATDPDGVLYVNGNEMPWILTMVETRRKDGESAASGAALFQQICAVCHGSERQGNPGQNVPSLVGVEKRLQTADLLKLLQTGKGVMPAFDFLTEGQRARLVAFVRGEAEPAGAEGASAGGGRSGAGGADALGLIPYSMTGYNRWLDTNGYPAVKPPWGTLNAIDLNTGSIRWKVPLGEFKELTAQGVPPTGTENYGGPLVTAGGLVFIAASRDAHLRAFDRKTGQELWKAPLPAGGYATPATYSVGGRQYVVIACGGGKMGTPSGDAYVAFALPVSR